MLARSRLSRYSIRIGIGASKRKDQALQLSGSPVDSLAGIYFFDFNDPPYLPSHRQDGERRNLPSQINEDSMI